MLRLVGIAILGAICLFMIAPPVESAGVVRERTVVRSTVRVNAGAAFRGGRLFNRGAVDDNVGSFGFRNRAFAFNHFNYDYGYRQRFFFNSYAAPAVFFAPTYVPQVIPVPQYVPYEVPVPQSAPCVPEVPQMAPAPCSCASQSFYAPQYNYAAPSYGCGNVGIYGANRFFFRGRGLGFGY